MEVVGAIAGILSLVSSESSGPSKIGRLHDLSREHSVIVIGLLCTVFSDACSVMDRVDHNVVNAPDEQVRAFMEAYTSSFAMIGVAGAIIAQVAISAMSLNRLEETHWTAEACFVTSLTTGALSVFFSCAANPALQGLHTTDDIKAFLTKPSRVVVRGAPDLEGPTRVASAYAAIMLVVPIVLLRVALNALLFGLGVYLGVLCTRDLIPAYGSGSLAILILYLSCSVFGLISYYLAQTLKYMESRPEKRVASRTRDFQRMEKELAALEYCRRPSTNQTPNARAPQISPDPRVQCNSNRPAVDGIVRAEPGIDGRVPADHLHAERSEPETPANPSAPNSSIISIQLPRAGPQASQAAGHLSGSPGMQMEMHASPGGASETRNPSSESAPQDIQAVLRDLMTAQENNLHATRQLLALYTAKQARTGVEAPVPQTD